MGATCPHCGADVGADSRFCADCGAALGRRCPACGEPADAAKRFCANCGAALAGEAGTPAPDGPEGEHKPVTVLFCDIVGSTSIAERIGAEAMHSLLSRYSDLALEELRFYGGTIDRFMGDGFMALMGVPTAYEDHARRAVLAALALRGRLLRDLTTPALEPVEVRMGLNSGSVVVGSLGEDPEGDHTAIGDTINVAARLQSIAEPGTILISDATARQVAGYVRCERIGPVAIRGRAEAVVAHRVLGLGPRRSPLDGLGSRPMGRFVGRERQLAALQELVAEAASGRGQVVGVVAEPGMGKSRIVAELRRSLAGERLTVLEGRCLSYGSAVPYAPLADIVRANCGIADGDSPAEVEAKGAFGLTELGIDPGPRVPLLLRMMGLRDDGAAGDLSPEAVKQRTFETVLTMCLTGSRRRPLLLVVEDLHWIDRVSEEFFARLVESIQGAALALVCTYRPGYQAPWMQISYATQLALPRLTLAESLVVLRAVLGERAADPEALEPIVDKADGNPFFLEELGRALLEESPGGPEHPVPGTVHDVLLARVDRLAEEPRRVLQTASVLGREFPLRLLEAVWSGPGGLEPHLAELRRLEFIHEQGGDGEPVYAFNHALTQDVAYQSLLSSRKRRLHEAVGTAYEALYEDLEPLAALLAYHWLGAAGEASDDLEALRKATFHLTHAGTAALRQGAFVEAEGFLNLARSCYERLPEQDRSYRTELEILKGLGTATFAIRGFGSPDYRRITERTFELARDRVSDRELFPILWGLWNTTHFAFAAQRAIQLGEQLMDIAKREDDDELRIQAHHALWTTLILVPDYARARGHLDAGVRLYRPEWHERHCAEFGGHDPGSCAQRATALTAWTTGMVDKAVAAGEEAIRLAQAHAFSKLNAMLALAFVHHQRGDLDAVADEGEAIVALARDRGLAGFVDWAAVLGAWVRGRRGDLERGIAEMEAVTERLGLKDPGYMAMLADLYLLDGRAGDGLRLIDELFVVVERKGERNYEPELHRLHGELLLRVSPEGLARMDEAEQSVRRALEVADEQGALSFSLRASMSLVRLRSRTGRTSEAVACLSKTLDRFSEGFGTQDLVEARALLERHG